LNFPAAVGFSKVLADLISHPKRHIFPPKTKRINSPMLQKFEQMCQNENSSFASHLNPSISGNLGLPGTDIPPT